MPRLYLPQLADQATPGTVLALPAPRAHYLTRVLRLKDGESVEAFDGTGGVCTATLQRAGQRQWQLHVDSAITRAPAPRDLHLAQAVIRGDAMDRTLQKCTELGLSDAWLVTSEFGQVNAKRIDARLEHWNAVTASACEQSGRTWLPQLHSAGTLLELTPPASLIALHPGTPTLSNADLLDCDGFAVGPEGGFSHAEATRLAQLGYRLRSLGGTILRAETAGVVALAALQQARGWR